MRAISEYSVKSIPVLDSNMEVFIFTPPGEGPFPGVLLAQHLPVGHTGLENDPFTLTTASRLAEAGYIVVVPFIFHWWPKTDSMEKKKMESRDDWTVADMQAAHQYLLSLPNVDSSRIAIVGHCWGGRVAWLSACYIEGLSALAVFYGGNIKTGLGEGSIAPLAMTEKIQCPVIGFFGNEDTNPSPSDVDGYRAALTAAGLEHKFYQYDGAGHAFQNFPSEERYCHEASEDAWQQLLLFLETKLA